jgi:hypothetical protein
VCALANLGRNMSKRLAIAACRDYIVREVLLASDHVTTEARLIPCFDLLTPKGIIATTKYEFVSSPWKKGDVW